MRTVIPYIPVFFLALVSLRLMAQSTQEPLKVKQIRKYGDLNEIVHDSTVYFYNDKNQLIETQTYLLDDGFDNDLKVTEYEYHENGQIMTNCANEYQAERLKNGYKQINVFDEQQNIISTTLQENWFLKQL